MNRHCSTCVTPIEDAETVPVGNLALIAGACRSSETDMRHPFPDLRCAVVVGAAPERQSSWPSLFARTGNYLRRRIAELRRQLNTHRLRAGPYVAFARETLARPRTIGAVCPSSRYLARAMAGELGDIETGLVLELGAGTGSITHALLEQGVDPTRLIAIERSPMLVAHLRSRFPAIRVIEGDATQLVELLGSDAGGVRAVVSALPLRSLPRTVAQQIVQQIQQLLPEHGVLVQFTYDLRTPSVWHARTLTKERTRVVWKNIPPARVDTFTRQPVPPLSPPACMTSSCG